jgi:RNA polymerase sigma-70 factor (ECF subfamily)
MGLPRESQLAEDLFNEHHRRIYAYCLSQLRSPEEAEDAVQATFLNACRSLMRGFEPETAQAWLLKVAQNVCSTKRRSSVRRARVERTEDLHAVEEVLPGPPERGDELIGLEAALETLPGQQRRAILLREWQGLSYREVAAAMGLTQAAVETLIFRARRSLASALERPAQPARRRLFRAVDVGALFFALKASVAAKASGTLAASVAVAASATMIATVPSDRSTPAEVREAPKVERTASAVERRPLPQKLFAQADGQGNGKAKGHGKPDHAGRGAKKVKGKPAWASQGRPAHASGGGKSQKKR